MQTIVHGRQNLAQPGEVVDHNKAGLGDISVRAFHMNGIDVFDVKDSKGVKGAYYPQHIISMFKKPHHMDGNWEGSRINTPWKRGNIVFIPAKSVLTFDTATPYNETVIRLKDDLFVTAAKDHVDYSQIDFTFRDVTSWATWKFGLALSGIVMDESYSQWPGLVEASSLSLVLALIRELAPNSTQAFTDVKYGLSIEKRRRVLDYIDTHLSERITHAELAAVCSLSVYHFSRKFKNQMGVSPLRYVAMARIEKAKRMLRSTSDSLAHVGLACGFASQSHMNVAFKKLVGVTPGAYRLGST